MRRARVSAALLGLTLAGCAHYAPAPPQPERFVAGFDARALAARPPGVAWTGADLLAVAIAQNPRVAEARAKYLAALAAVKAAKAPPGPSLTLTAEYANESPHWGYSATGDAPLDYGARRSARIDTARLQALQAFYDLGETIWSVRTDLEKARGDLISARAELALADKAVEVRGERAARADARVRAGQDARTLAIAAQTDSIAAQRRRAAALGREKAAVAALAKALGVSPPAAEPLNLASLAAAPADLEARLGAWRRDAALSRRDILRAVADYDIAENELRLQIAQQYPAIGLGPAYNYDHGVTKLPLSLSLALPPWDLNRGEIAHAEAARTDAGRALELAQANALAEVDAAAAAYRTAAADAVRTRSRDAPLAQRSLEAAQRSVRAGETDRVDELNARGATLDVQLSLVDAEHAETAARADLENTLRRSFDPAETALIEAEMTKLRGVK